MMNELERERIADPLETWDWGIMQRGSKLGFRTAVVPKARVHHGFHASDRRRSDRVPTTLHEIGASSMVFLRRHADEAAWPAALARRRATEKIMPVGLCMLATQ